MLNEGLSKFKSSSLTEFILLLVILGIRKGWYNRVKLGRLCGAVNIRFFSFSSFLIILNISI
jgi:hypothetical protein